MATEHLDVVVVGAGLSGIGAGFHLQDQCPGKSYAILEARASMGGTWDLFRYPGIRSDSDMFTLGFSFRPWKDAKAIADGPSILQYVKDTAGEYGIDRHIRFGHRLVRANWSSEDGRWELDIERGDARLRLTCGFLFFCSGYYRYDEGYLPTFPGREKFKGRFFHPQHWPADLDYAGKKVVIIGSGATAVTLVPSMAETAGHVTMLQRSPSYVMSLPAKDPVADALRRWLPEKTAHKAVRWKNVLISMAFYEFCRRYPKQARAWLSKEVKRAVPKDFDVDTHFNPAYNPWEQRLCLVPDRDLFRTIRKGRASVVTDQIESFTENGIRLKSGQHLDADIVIAATGLQLLALGGAQVTVDGAKVEMSGRYSYKGVMINDVPNAAACIGYTNASWTLRADLIAKFVCRLLNHMDRRGATVATPRVTDATLQPEPLLPLTSGYIQRSIDAFPKQGTKSPWKVRQNYIADLLGLQVKSLDDGSMEYSNPASVARTQKVAA
ncbi:MAG TPA: NAD(P)/FAD-dependent oxidoreductase [Nevskiaceae bacterium]|nr:NAD(P)/FAD-dependent oxidoreductase [Nevskiaceae bacterium]